MPDRIVVVNTSPLLYLHQANLIHVLQMLYGTVVVPNAVQAELRLGHQRRLPVPDVSSLPWISIKQVQSDALIPAVADLGRGEAEVIALGLVCPGSLVILDDQLARATATAAGLEFTGTLGVLIKAKRQGHVASVVDVMRFMRQKGMWISDAVLRQVARLADEAWE